MLEFDPHKSFINLAAFKWTFFGLLFFSFFTAGIIYSNSNLSINWSYQGFNHALTIFKVPLGVLATIIPAIALLAANHRSEQAKEQMRLSESQNKFSNYYKHTEEFEKHITTCESGTKKRIARKRLLHGVIFPDARNGSYNSERNIINELKNIAMRMAKIYATEEKDILRNTLQEELEADKEKATNQVRSIARRYHIIEPIRDENTLIASHREKDFIDVSRDAVACVRFMVDIIQFDEMASFPQEVLIFSRLYLDMDESRAVEVMRKYSKNI